MNGLGIYLHCLVVTQYPFSKMLTAECFKEKLLVDFFSLCYSTNKVFYFMLYFIAQLIFLILHADIVSKLSFLFYFISIV